MAKAVKAKKSISNIKISKKVVRKTRSELYLVNLKYMGQEPDFNGTLTNSEYMKAMNWYNTMADNSDAFEYLETYLKANDRISEAKKLKKVPDAWLPRTAAWIARLWSRGYTLPETAGPFFEKKLEEAFSHIKVVEEKEEGTPAKVISIQERMKDRASEIIADIEEMIDSGVEFSLYEWLKNKEIPASYCAAIIQYYAPWLGELLEASEGADKQLNEAYAYLGKRKLKQRITFLNDLIEDCERYAGVVKKVRKPRAPRPVSKEKLLKSLKYQKEDSEFKIASISPEKLLGAQELWTFNTKYKILSVFRAAGATGLSIKGTTLIGYDPDTSVSRGTGRAATTIVDKVSKGGKLVLRKVMDDLKTQKPLQHRINENTILLKVV